MSRSYKHTSYCGCKKVNFIKIKLIEKLDKLQLIKTFFNQKAHLNHLCIEDLKLETSNFIVKHS